jgi:hypothetical protein
MDCSQDEVALEAHHPLMVHRWVVSLLEQLALLVKRADEERQILAPLIPQKFLIDFLCSHRAAQWQHQSQLELVLPSWVQPSWQLPSLLEPPRLVSSRGTSPSTCARQVLLQLMMLT